MLTTFKLFRDERRCEQTFIDMELTLEQALQRGVEAHKAGKIQEADGFYTAILKADPKHPDANHNMGVLAVGVGKVHESLPFFITALETNSSIAQYWLSYIDALIRLNKMADAQAVFDRAKSNGAKGDGFDLIKKRIKASLVETKKTVNNHGNILDTLKLDQACNIAKRKVKDGLTEEAKKIYQDILKKFPKNKKALHGIKNLASKSLANKPKTEEPPTVQLQGLVNLCTPGLYQQAKDQILHLLKKYPKSINLYNILGAANKGLGNLDEAMAAYTKALSIKPDLADVHNNIGNVLKDQGKIDKAIEAYKKALSIKPNLAESYNNIGNALQYQGRLDDAVEAFDKAISMKPDFADAHNNMANALQDLGKLEESIEAYTKAISIKPDYAEAYNNMGVVLKEQGKLEEAIEAYKRALALKPNYDNAILNASTVRIQISDTKLITEELEKILENHSLDLIEMPKFKIQQAVRAFLICDQELVRKHLNIYKSYPPSSIAKLQPEDQVFCSAYNQFLQKLIVAPLVTKPNFADNRAVFHLGESHCLSYAHRLIKINGTGYTIRPRITFGGKAFHFSTEKENAFKAITKANFHNLPDASIVFLSFGEIDCRPDEGFISAATKHKKPIKDLVSDTVKGYVDWFIEQNSNKHHSLFFFNVPAPVYNKKYLAEVNETVMSTIKLFNCLLNKTLKDYDAKIIDVYKLTVGHDGFSNSLFHIDDVHLSSDAINEIEQQIGTFL